MKTISAQKKSLTRARTLNRSRVINDFKITAKVSTSTSAKSSRGYLFKAEPVVEPRSPTGKLTRCQLRRVLLEKRTAYRQSDTSLRPSRIMYLIQDLVNTLSAPKTKGQEASTQQKGSLGSPLGEQDETKDLLEALEATSSSDEDF